MEGEEEPLMYRAGSSVINNGQDIESDDASSSCGKLYSTMLVLMIACLAIGFLVGLLVFQVRPNHHSPATDYCNPYFGNQFFPPDGYWPSDKDRNAASAKIDWSTARVSLGMYVSPQVVADANQMFWNEIRSHLVPRLMSAGLIESDDDVPITLYYGEEEYYWDYNMITDGNMLFGQLCGYPWVITIEHRLWHHMLASPSYSPECCQGSDDEGKVAAMSKKQLSNNDVEEPRSRQSGDGEMMSILYRSFIVVQANSSYSTIADLKGATFAVNEVRSNSGYNFPRYLFKDHAHKGSFFANVTVTGSHSTSLKDVQQGLVDAAAIDCVTFSLFAKHDPEMVQGVRILSETTAAPSGPYLSSAYFGEEVVAMVRESLFDALADTSSNMTFVRETLLLNGARYVSEETYLPIWNMAMQSTSQGTEEIGDRDFF